MTLDAGFIDRWLVGRFAEAAAVFEDRYFMRSVWDQLREDLARRNTYSVSIEYNALHDRHDIRLTVDNETGTPCRNVVYSFPEELLQHAGWDLIVQHGIRGLRDFSRQHGFDVADELSRAIAEYERNGRQRVTRMGNGRTMPTVEINGTRLHGVMDIAVERPIDTVYSAFSASPYAYRRQRTEVTITGVLTDDMQIRLNEIWRNPGVNRYEVQANYDGLTTYHLEFIPQDITRSVDANGATLYAVTLPGYRPAMQPQRETVTWDVNSRRRIVTVDTTLPNAPVTLHANYEGFSRDPYVKQRAQSDAQKRAEKLLRRHLTPYQRRQWKRYRYVTVRVPHPDTGKPERYQISESGVKQIELRGNEQLASYCIVPSVDYDVAPADKVLARLLLLRTDYKRFMKTANKLGGRQQPDPDLYNFAALY